nr:unnamed protein product [Callosobruchus chinensis]
MLLSETWLDQNTDSDLIAIPGYFLFRQDRVGRAGGVAAYVKVDLHCSVIDINLTSITGDLEFLLFRVKYQTYSCIIGVSIVLQVQGYKIILTLSMKYYL